MVSPTPSAQSNTSPRSQLSSSPLSLAFLFYMVTIGAVLSACLRPLSADGVLTTQSLSLAIVIGGGAGSTIGFLIGLMWVRSQWLALIGLFSGLAVGAVAGALALVRADHFLELVWIALGGSWLIILTICLSTRFSKSSDN